MNNKVKIIGLILLALIAYSLGRVYDQNKILSPKNKTSKDYFMDGCLDGGSKPYCECTYNYLIDNYGVKGLTELGINYLQDDSQIPDEVMEAAKACASKY